MSQSTVARPSRPISTTSSVQRILFLFFLCLLIQSSSCAHLLALRSDPSSKNCKVYSKPSVHQAMDRICEMCHEMFSPEKPNMRAECRSKCFRNDQFRNCLEMFSSMPQPIVEEKRRRF